MLPRMKRGLAVELWPSRATRTRSTDAADRFGKPPGPPGPPRRARAATERPNRDTLQRCQPSFSVCSSVTVALVGPVNVRHPPSPQRSPVRARRNVDFQVTPSPARSGRRRDRRSPPPTEVRRAERIEGGGGGI